MLESEMLEQMRIHRVEAEYAPHYTAMGLNLVSSWSGLCACCLCVQACTATRFLF
jgi:hypothetical protein